MEWSQLFTESWSGDSVVKDAEHMAALIRDMIARRGVRACLGTMLTRHILEYIWLRSRRSWITIQRGAPLFVEPVGWNDHTEEIWQDWIQDQFTDEDWQTEVLDPIFGTDERPWEGYVPGWRHELLAYLPQWIEPNLAIVEAWEASQLEEPAEESEDAKIDPYILEHGTAKQKKAALRTV